MTPDTPPPSRHAPKAGFIALGLLLLIAISSTLRGHPRGIHAGISPLRAKSIVASTPGSDDRGPLGPAGRPQSHPGERGTPDHHIRAQDYVLTPSLVHNTAVNNSLIVTWANYHYRDFVRSWVHHVRASGAGTFLVGAMDEPMLRWLVAEGIPAFAMQGDVGTGDLGFGSDKFAQMGVLKTTLIRDLLRMGVEVLISDVDTVWLGDPFPFFRRHPQAAVLYSSDMEEPTVVDGGLEDPHASSFFSANIGVFFLKPRALPLVEDWLRTVEANPSAWDQEVFDRLLKDSMVADEGPGRLFSAYNGTLLAGVLPVSKFCGGHAYYVANRTEGCLVVHATQQVSGTSGKRARMREAGFFVEEPERYQHHEGFVTYVAEPPSELMKAARTADYTGALETARPHIDLVDAQLQQVRNAAVLARVLGGRALVLPPLWCGLDRFWGPFNSSLDGVRRDVPFVCPADYVLDVGHLDAKALGGWRERGFLERPEAAHLRASMLRVRVCDSPTDERCRPGSRGSAAGGQLWIPPGLTTRQLRSGLARLARPYRVIEVSSGIGRLLAPTHHLRREHHDLANWAATWCCATDSIEPVNYSMFRDITRAEGEKEGGIVARAATERP